MSKQHSGDIFRENSADYISMMGAISRAKDAVKIVSNCPIDSIRSCTSQAEGGWKVVFDLVESLAKLGDNDLISTYEFSVNSSGEVTEFLRLEKFYREDGARG